MADIETRDVVRGYIRTLDRATSGMHRVKEQTIRSRSNEEDGRNPPESACQDAHNAMKHLAGDSTEAVMWSVAGQAARVVRNRQNPPKPDSSEDMPGDVQNAFREHGVKSMRSRQVRERMLAAELSGIREERRNSELRSKGDSRPEESVLAGRDTSSRHGKNFGRRQSGIIRNRRKALFSTGTADPVMRRQLGL